jgi:Arc/MetJ-type ribon-helix-helix transcriptional regulator
MKVSVSLTSEDLVFVDEYVHRHDMASRSAVLHSAIDLLRMSDMEDAYAAAWAEWEDGDDAELWDATAGDGAPAAMADAAR